LIVLLGAGSANAVRADAAPRHVSSLLYRLARTSQAPRADQLVRQATDRLREALRAAPSDFHTLCEHARALRSALDEQTARAGRRRALAVLARQTVQRRAYLDDALARLRDAQRMEPSNPEIVQTTARALSLWEEPQSLDSCRVRRRDAEAIAAFEQLASLDPTFAASDVAFQLGLLLTRSHAFEAAAAAYARAIVLSFDARDVATAQGNLAEVIMLAGDPARALPHYERALKLAQGGRDYALVLFGAAVALDRLGEHEAALEKAMAALDAAGRSLSVLRAPGVFFEPDYELQYYEALGQEALARLLPETRALALDAAMAGYRAFLEHAESGNPYRVSAQLNLDQLSSELHRSE
jgi:tetratricopeptide (TPR) repeat protein